MAVRQPQIQKSLCSPHCTGKVALHFSDKKMEATLKLRRGWLGGIGGAGEQGVRYV